MARLVSAAVAAAQSFHVVCARLLYGRHLVDRARGFLWYGSGEDPYRTGTEGEWSEEQEITKLPGSSVNVSGVEMYHNPGPSNSGVPGWHYLYRGKPIPRLAVKQPRPNP